MTAVGLASRLVIVNYANIVNFVTAVSDVVGFRESLTEEFELGPVDFQRLDPARKRRGRNSKLGGRP